uniref:CSON008008 protein n=1 Tax=Culicoides sonorensis TaxID=179676 RepID=A0A336KDT0_CULSO
MCRCCRLCWEDFYWNCIEEKFCFDEDIAKYNPEEDENYIKKDLANGYINGGLTGQTDVREVRRVSENGEIENNNSSPICIQPKLTQAEFYREIQTTVPILAPEVLAAFANSQIFNEHVSSKLTSPISSPPAGVHQSTINAEMRSRTDSNAEDLLKRLEDKPKPVQIDLRRASESPVTLRHKIPEIVEEKHNSDDKLSSVDGAVSSNQSKEYLTPETYGSMKIVNKNLQLEAPYFSFRPASENDIFAITQPANSNATNRISQTPEVPSVSFNALPKNYLDTPSIGEYRESKSLYEIQTAGIHQQADVEKLSMPRYYSKSHLFAKNSNSSSESMKDADYRTPKRIEKSRRLKNIRMQLPPLMIGVDKSKEGLPDLVKSSRERSTSEEQLLKLKYIKTK